jgi:hypothetical protein
VNRDFSTDTPDFDNYLFDGEAGTPNAAEVSNPIVDRYRQRWIAVPLVVVLVAFGVAIYAFAIQAEAKSILKDVSGLRVGVSSTQDVQALAAHHKHALRDGHCGTDRCIIAFEVYNTWYIGCSWNL